MGRQARRSRGRVIRSAPFHLGDDAATRAVGAELAGLVQGGDAIALVGDLGAGKTTLVAGMCATLGGEIATSPTFSLVHEVRGGRLVVWHVDLYRLERAAELVELGLDELFGDPRGIVIVEWADKLPVMPPDHLRIELAHAGPEVEAGGLRPTAAVGRELRISGTGTRGRALAAGMLRFA